MNEFAGQLPKNGYNYANPVSVDDGTDPLFLKIIETAAFRRLRDVRFLGGIDYSLISSPNGSLWNQRYTRYQHSLGVGCLALLYADLRGLSEKQKRLAFTAALLHDIGHGPLSHSLEPLFEEVFGINHKTTTRGIITGRLSLGKDVVRALRAYHIDPDHVAAIIDGEDDPFEGFFSGPINFDTIEAVMRARRYLKPKTIFPNPRDVTRAALLRNTRADQQLVDSFWNYKNEIYNLVIGSREGVTADYLCQRIIRDNMGKFSERDFLSTEKTLFRKVPHLCNTLRMKPIDAARKKFLTEPLSFRIRNFSVNSEANFYDRNDSERYTQTRQSRILVPLENSQSLETV